MSFCGKTAVVTGAAGGLGSEIVKALVSEHAHVLAVDLPGERLSALEQRNVIPVAADLSRPEEIDRVAAIGGDAVDFLCNNAGVVDALGFVDEIPPVEWHRVLAVNLTAPFLLSAALIPRMLDRGGGAIVNTASISGLRGGRAGPAYVASKWGLVGLTQQIAASYGRYGIRCNAVAPSGMVPRMPGVTITDRFVRLRKDRPLWAPESVPTKDVADVILFLLSDASRHLNGLTLPVDDGLMAM
jgi:NAD(P)-dependent dehydrogenase (short-subunit alcohol dehydrogenase family)